MSRMRPTAANTLLPGMPRVSVRLPRSTCPQYLPSPAGALWSERTEPRLNGPHSLESRGPVLKLRPENEPV